MILNACTVDLLQSSTNLLDLVVFYRETFLSLFIEIRFYISMAFVFECSLAQVEQNNWRRMHGLPMKRRKTLNVL